MAITTMDGLAAAVAAAQDIVIQKTQATAPAVGFWQSLWAEAGNPAAGTLTVGNTANGLVPTDATAGSPTIAAFTGANTGYIASFGAVATQPSVLVLYDRIFHAGSFALTTTTPATLGTQPSFTGRVPGANYGEVEIWIELNVVYPGTSTTLTVNYQDGLNAAQNATLHTGVTLNAAPTKRMYPLALANGTGCQRINSVTAATPAASGTFNIVCLRRLAQHNVVAANLSEPRQDFFRLGSPTVFTDSCLALMALGTGTTAGQYYCDFQIANG